MVGEEKRHQMMQNLFGGQSEQEEEEEEIKSEHESSRQPDYVRFSNIHRRCHSCKNISYVLAKRISNIHRGCHSSSAVRLWRPAAQRNVRNQWSKLASLRRDWSSAAAAGRSHATSIVNSYLSQKYMDGMDMNVLSDMPDIKKKARRKLFKQQELYRSKMLSSYRDMVTIVTHMVNACNSMRCYNRVTSSSPLAQFSYSSEGSNDSGDCGGIPVFTFWPIALFEELAWEVVQMFISEIKLKRLLVMDLLSIYDDNVAEVVGLDWSDEFYEGEFKDLCIANLFSKETCEAMLPSPESCTSSTSTVQQKQFDVLQVYITAWMVDVSINRSRVDEILTIVGSEMCANFLET